MRYVESPTEYKLQSHEYGLFLAGGITGCPDWQSEMVKLLSAKESGTQRDEDDLVLFNPRRQNFPIQDPSAAKEQIQWEFHYLRMATGILFWFPCETLNPIVLYELGAWSMTRKPLFVGVHPDYQRKQDVQIQTGLARPDVSIVYSLYDLAELVKKRDE